MSLEYRPAEKADSEKIAELINIASGGVLEYLFHDLLPEMTAVQIMAYNLEEEKYPHSYKNAIVCSDRGNVVGMAFSYPVLYHTITDEMRDFFPKDRLEHLSELYSSFASNSWYLNALGVNLDYRNKGIGTNLVNLTKDRARDKGFSILSLTAFTDNSLALALYKVLGFRVVKQFDLDGNEFIPHQGGCLLLECDI
jgi:ribosomal protein S18 acetylase RimI-like enzyme